MKPNILPPRPAEFRPPATVQARPPPGRDTIVPSATRYTTHDWHARSVSAYMRTPIPSSSALSIVFLAAVPSPFRGSGRKIPSGGAKMVTQSGFRGASPVVEKCPWRKPDGIRPERISRKNRPPPIFRTRTSPPPPRGSPSSRRDGSRDKSVRPLPRLLNSPRN